MVADSYLPKIPKIVRPLPLGGHDKLWGISILLLRISFQSLVLLYISVRSVPLWIFKEVQNADLSFRRLHLFPTFRCTTQISNARETTAVVAHVILAILQHTYVHTGGETMRTRPSYMVQAPNANWGTRVMYQENVAPVWYVATSYTQPYDLSDGCHR